MPNTFTWKKIAYLTSLMYGAYSNNNHYNPIFAIRLAEEECEETFRNGIVKLAGFCTAPYGAAVPEMRWNSQPLGSPLRQLCSSRNYVCCLGEINLFFLQEDYYRTLSTH